MRDWIRLRDVALSTECDVQPDGDDLQPRADTEPTSVDTPANCDEGRTR